MSGSALGALHTLLDAPIAELDDQIFSVRHALVLGAGDGTWAAAEQATAQACRAVDVHPPTPDAVQAAGAAWRRARRLHAGAELRTWLAARDLDTSRWRGFLERRVAATTGPGADDPAAATDGEGLLAALAVDLRCSGVLEQLADRLLSAAAAATALGRRRVEGDGLAGAERAAGTLIGRALGLTPADLLAAAARVEAVEAALAALARERVAEAAIDDRIRDRRLAWTVVTWDEVEFPTEGAAREAAFMVEIDGCALAEPAALAGCHPARRRREVGDLTDDDSRRLLAALPRQLVGPWPRRDRWPLLRVVERVEPSPEDDARRARARDELVEELLVPHRAAGRVLA